MLMTLVVVLLLLLLLLMVMLSTMTVESDELQRGAASETTQLSRLRGGPCSLPTFVTCEV
jgi:hypothetical protein